MTSIHQPKNNKTVELQNHVTENRLCYGKGATLSTASIQKNPPRNVYAYEDHIGKNRLYNIWTSTIGEFYNPFDVDNRNEYGWVSVKKNVFDLYIKFLQENRQTLIEEAHKLHTFND